MNADASFARRIRLGLLPLVVLCAYLLPQPYFERLNNPNENVRVYLTRAIVEHRTLSIDPIVAEWGYVNDKATRDGRLYAGKAPGSSLLAVPGWWVWHTISDALDRTPGRREAVLVCRVAGTILPVLLGLIAFARWLRRRIHDPTTRDLAFVALGIGSTMYPYGVLFASHTLVAVFVLGVLLCAERHTDEPGRAWPPLLAGFLAGWAICAEYPALFGAAIAAFWGLARSPVRLRFALLVVAGGLIPAALLAGYHHAAFGGVLETAYDHLENPDFRESHSEGFYGLARIQGGALWGSFFAPSNGLFFFAPWTLLPVALLPLAIRRPEIRSHAIATLAALVSYAVFVSMVDNWRGGWTAGPRYIVPVLPFLAWYAAVALDRLRDARSHLPLMLTFATLTLVSTVVCGVSAAVFPHYPERIANPIFEIGFRLPEAGLYPANRLASLGVPLAPAFYLTVLCGPALVALALVRARSMGGPVEPAYPPRAGSRAMYVAVTAAASLLLLSIMSIPRTADDTTLHREVQAVLKVWEPMPNPAWNALRSASLSAEVLAGTPRDALEQAATAAAREGLDQTAVVLHARAWRMRTAPVVMHPAWRTASDNPPPDLRPPPEPEPVPEEAAPDSDGTGDIDAIDGGLLASGMRHVRDPAAHLRARNGIALPQGTRTTPWWSASSPNRAPWRLLLRIARSALHP